MRELIDCHLHTSACGHATGTAAQMIGAAVFAGLSGVVMTEHLPLPPDLDEGGGFAPSEEALFSYASDVRETAERVKGLQVVLGAEADYVPERPDLMREQERMAREAGVEVLLGSVHFLDGWPFDSPDHLDGWESRGVDVVWERYFLTWCDAARSGRFDVMAHPDLPKKFGHRPSFDPMSLYREAASAAADAGVLIEVSTAGLRKPVAELYPGAQFLSCFREAGVEACIGSDAHAPAEVGFKLDTACDALIASGYTRMAFPLGSREVRWVDL